MKKSFFLFVLMIFVYASSNSLGKLLLQDSIYWGELYPDRIHNEFVKYQNNSNKNLHFVEVLVLAPEVLDSLSDKIFVKPMNRITQYPILEPNTEGKFDIMIRYPTFVNYIEGFTLKGETHQAKYLFKYKYENEDVLHTDTLTVIFKEVAYPTTLHVNIQTKPEIYKCGSSNYTRFYLFINNSSDSFLRLDSIHLVNLPNSNNSFSFPGIDFDPDTYYLSPGRSFSITGSNIKESIVKNNVNLENHVQIAAFFRDSANNISINVLDTISVVRYKSDNILFNKSFFFTEGNAVDTVKIKGYQCTGNNVLIEDIRLLGDWQVGEYRSLFAGMLPIDMNKMGVSQENNMDLPIFALDKPVYGTYEGVVELKYKIGVGESKYRYIYVNSNYRVTGISEPEPVEKFNIFPNPASNEIYFSQDFINSEITIFDNLGQSVYSGRLISNTYNVSHLGNGVYNVIIKDGNKFNSSRFIVFR